MKMLRTGRVSLLAVALASVGLSTAARETISFTVHGVTFTIVAFGDGRNKPYRLKFTQDDTLLLYMFNKANQVTNIKVGAERYKVIYNEDDNVKGVKRMSPTRRALLAAGQLDAAEIEGRRLDFDDCADCEEAFDAVCEGALSVCLLVDFDYRAATVSSIDTVCGTFDSACWRLQASVACQDQCTNEEVGGGGGGSSRNSCLDPTSADFKCAFSGGTSIEFTDCDLTDDDVPFLPACFEEFGRTNIQTLLLDDGFEVTSYPEGTFAGLSELTFLDLFSNGLLTVSEGLFDGLNKLEFLDIRFNDLVSLPEGAFSDLSSLKILRLFGNDLTPEGLPSGLFSGTPQLQELDLGGNNLRDLTSLEGLFDGLTELIELNLSDCNFPEELFAGLTNLEELELPETNPADFGASLSGLTGLRTLRAGFNDLLLTKDSFSGLVNLESLDLEGCFLTPLPAGVFSPLVNLVSLDLEECRLTTLPAGVFSPLVNLVSLRLFVNENLQCLPASTATDITLHPEDIMDGTCECTPTWEVFCDDGFTCQSGMAGYTCVAEQTAIGR